MSERQGAIWYGFWTTCDCIAAAVVEEPEHRRDTARFVSQMIRDDLRVRRIEGQRPPWRCDRHPAGTPTPWEIERAAKRRRRSAPTTGMGL